MIYKNVKMTYNLTDEKVPSNHLVSRYVYGCIWQFYDVEGAERWQS